MDAFITAGANLFGLLSVSVTGSFKEWDVDKVNSLSVNLPIYVFGKINSGER